MTATVHDAYEYARQNVYIKPLHTVIRDGVCTCSDTSANHKAGKHPCVKGDGSKDPKQIREWWRRFPNAGIGIHLELSGIVDVAPDSEEWDTEFQRRGLPATAVYQSGSGAGHTHYLYRRPDGCPQTSINRSGEYDIKSNGIAVAPPSVSGKGAYVWLTPHERVNLNGGLPDAPAWVVDMLAESAAKREQRAKRPGEHDAPPAGGDADEPPVVLDEDALAVWRGERFKAKPNGDVDRSASLLWIGRVLYDAGMTRRGLVAELRARDERLGWRKYSDRADGGDQYNAIVDELEANGRNARVTMDGTDGNGWKSRALVAEAQLAEIRELQSLTAAVRRNRHVKVVAGVAVALAFEIASAEKRGGGNGAHLIRLGRLGDSAGCSNDSASRRLRRLESWGSLTRELHRGLIEIVNPDTGEVEERLCRDLYVTLPHGPVAFLQALAAYVPVKAPKPGPTTCTPGRHCKTCSCHAPETASCGFGDGATSAPDECPSGPDIPNAASCGFGSRQRDPTDDETRDGVRACAWCGARTVGHVLCSGCDPTGNSRLWTPHTTEVPP